MQAKKSPAVQNSPPRQDTKKSSVEISPSRGFLIVSYTLSAASLRGGAPPSRVPNYLLQQFIAYRGHLLQLCRCDIVDMNPAAADRCTDEFFCCSFCEFSLATYSSLCPIPFKTDEVTPTPLPVRLGRAVDITTLPTCGVSPPQTQIVQSATVCG